LATPQPAKCVGYSRYKVKVKLNLEQAIKILKWSRDIAVFFV
jgi:hypothetical protein